MTDLLNDLDVPCRRQSLSVDVYNRPVDDVGSTGDIGTSGDWQRSMSASPPHSPSNNSSSGEEPEQPSDSYKYQRRRSRAVLYQLSGTYGKQKSTKSKLQLNKVSARRVGSINGSSTGRFICSVKKSIGKRTRGTVERRISVEKTLSIHEHTQAHTQYANATALCCVCDTATWPLDASKFVAE